MEENIKTLKQYCKEAKKRLKTGFWQDYRKNLNTEIEKAESIGVSANKVKEYIKGKVRETIKKTSDDEEEFYNKVKDILIAEGEISNAIGRLTDKEVFDSLTYEEKQRYTLSLSEKYLKAVERFNREKSLGFSVEEKAKNI